ncbi:MAG TPA: GGDEF domain-containing protein, partial [Rhodanobacteraceae bacterium]|nr:GGDEF domain-containing protein [Rhodanobacteraceae bacterium]
DQTERPAPPVPLVITRAIIDGRELPYAALPTAERPIHIQHGQNLRLGFALLDYRRASTTRYAYRLEGFDRDWNPLASGTLPAAIYTNLPHGAFQLKLRATTLELHPRTVESTIDVVVDPRWYETWPARAAGLLLLLGLVLALVHARTAYLHRQAIQLQRQIDAHTTDLRAANSRLDKLANTDELTGAFNRRRFMQYAEELCHADDQQAHSIAILDLDHFKRINDHYGHLAGDATLRETVASVRRQCRAQDLLGRFGGEEFVLCLPATVAAQAMATCERIRDAVQAAPILFEGQKIAVTTSVGIAERRPGETLKNWLARADAALYQAKRGGRNRCELAD